MKRLNQFYLLVFAVLHGVACKGRYQNSKLDGDVTKENAPNYKLEIVEIPLGQGLSLQACIYTSKDLAVKPAKYFLQIPGTGHYTCTDRGGWKTEQLVKQGVVHLFFNKRFVKYDPNNLSDAIEIKDIMRATGYEELKADALIAFDFFAKHLGIEASQIILWGHSEGSVLVPHIASKRQTGRILLTGLILEDENMLRRQYVESEMNPRFEAFDEDKNKQLSSKEFSIAYYRGLGHLQFGLCDRDNNDQVSLDELLAEQNRFITKQLNDDQSDYFFDASVSSKWWRSFLQSKNLTDTVLKLKQQVEIHHGKSDELVDVKPVEKLQQKIRERKLKNFTIHLHEGLGHLLSDEIANRAVGQLLDVDLRKQSLKEK